LGEVERRARRLECRGVKRRRKLCEQKWEGMEGKSAIGGKELHKGGRKL